VAVIDEDQAIDASFFVGIPLALRAGTTTNDAFVRIVSLRSNGKALSDEAGASRRRAAEATAAAAARGARQV
jgi:hypothetical protein